ncbi:chorismate mutase [Mycobacterium paragordonae]|jgi:chorismate mutase|uniref:chorismate mutase n=1 Tax=Mycobacterium paragordonae TaxID=1389713 RepID=UPI0009ECE71B|nr:MULTISPECIES: chorismate mutase [Mycobacterium]TDK95203.1 chorismate mutase [Mycobacterium paragordonae]TDK95513.1 chorismate mutase [Mycobacterium paragordonae]TDL07807.1 chorismate mutase [Mycobacterium paragordonae]
MLQVVSRAVPVAVAILIVGCTAPQGRAEGAGPLTALVDALAERLTIAEPVAAYKWGAHGDIEDPVRIQQELATLREDAASAHVDPDYVARVFSDQIDATEAIEYRRFADWKLEPAAVPPPPADLAGSRAVIDALNTKILSHISLNWSLLHSPACAGLLHDARAEVTRQRNLDDLYRRALTAATASYCPTQPSA